MPLPENYDIRNLHLHFQTNGATVEKQMRLEMGDILFELSDGREIIWDNLHCRGVENRRDIPISDEGYRQEFMRRFGNAICISPYNQKELAEELGVSEIIISRFRSGKSLPDYPTIMKLSRKLKCSVDFLTNFDEYSMYK